MMGPGAYNSLESTEDQETVLNAIQYLFDRNWDTDYQFLKKRKDAKGTLFLFHSVMFTCLMHETGQHGGKLWV